MGIAPTGLSIRYRCFRVVQSGTGLTFSLYLQIVNRLVISNSTLIFRWVSSLLSLASLVLAVDFPEPLNYLDSRVYLVLASVRNSGSTISNGYDCGYLDSYTDVLVGPVFSDNPEQ